MHTSPVNPDQPTTVLKPIGNGWLVVGMVLSLFAWWVTLFTPLEGWSTVPLGVGLAGLIGSGLVGSIPYKAVVCSMVFLGVGFVCAYFTLLARYLLSERNGDDLTVVRDLGFVMFLFPVLIIVPLLYRGIAISMNSKRRRIVDDQT